MVFLKKTIKHIVMLWMFIKPITKKNKDKWIAFRASQTPIKEWKYDGLHDLLHNDARKQRFHQLRAHVIHNILMENRNSLDLSYVSNIIKFI